MNAGLAWLNVLFATCLDMFYECYLLQSKRVDANTEIKRCMYAMKECS